MFILKFFFQKKNFDKNHIFEEDNFQRRYMFFENYFLRKYVSYFKTKLKIIFFSSKK